MLLRTALGIALFFGVGLSTVQAVTPQFSPPNWWPLRTPARVGCVKTNCSPPGFDDFVHGYWAIDLLGAAKGDPVFAAGYGIAHVGGRENGCSLDGGSHLGNWAWIDHGAGEITRYHHLDTINITGGQRVTPRTQIGTVGTSGDCKDPYLHYVRKIGGLRGKPVYMGKMQACLNLQVVSYPEYAGYANWDDMPHGSVIIRSEGAGCGPDAKMIDAPTIVSVQKVSPESVHLEWSGKGASFAVEYVRWIDSHNKWTAPQYSYGKNEEQTIDGLVRDRVYRFRVAGQTNTATSSWSAYREVNLAPPPGKPKITDVFMQKGHLKLKWDRPRSRQRLLYYDVGVEKLGKTTTWYRVATRRSFRKPLRKGKYRLYVKAHNNAGASKAGKAFLRVR